MANDEDDYNERLDKQIDGMAAGISSVLDLSVDHDVLKTHALQIQSMELTQTWEAKCRPYVEWIRTQPSLEWFVGSENISRLGTRTYMRLRATCVGFTDEQFQTEMYKSWYRMLEVFALSHGCPFKLEDQYPSIE